MVIMWNVLIIALMLVALAFYSNIKNIKFNLRNKKTKSREIITRHDIYN